MAIYHFHAAVVKRSAGHSATAAAAYQSGECITDERTGEVHDYRRRKGVDDAVILAPENAPAWAHDRTQLWNAAELAEKRHDAQVCRSFDIALPAELSDSQRYALAVDFCKKVFVQGGMVVDLAFHSPHQWFSENYHVHVKATLREIGPEGFGLKNREWNSREQLESWREAWADFGNRALERAGFAARIDHRTLEAQGIDREPTIHMGRAAKLEEKGISTVRGERNRGVIDLNAYRAELHQVEQTLAAIQEEKIQVKAELVNLQEERERRRQRPALEPRSPDNYTAGEALQRLNSLRGKVPAEVWNERLLPAIILLKRIPQQTPVPVFQGKFSNWVAALRKLVDEQEREARGVER